MLQEIDDLLSGGLTDEDEEAVLAELDAITKGDEAVELPSVPDEDLPEIGKVAPKIHSAVIPGSYCTSGFYSSENIFLQALPFLNKYTCIIQG